MIWPLTAAILWLKAPSERTLGSTIDLLCLTAVFVALKLDGVIMYSWRVSSSSVHIMTAVGQQQCNLQVHGLLGVIPECGTTL